MNLVEEKGLSEYEAVELVFDEFELLMSGNQSMNWVNTLLSLDAFVPLKGWTPYAARMYAISYMKMWFPEWNRSEHKALMKLWGKRVSMET